MAYASSARLSSDLGRACASQAGADLFLVARNRLRFAVHKAVMSCRCRVLEVLIDKTVAARDDAVRAGEVWRFKGDSVEI